MVDAGPAAGSLNPPDGFAGHVVSSPEATSYICLVVYILPESLLGAAGESILPAKTGAANINAQITSPMHILRMGIFTGELLLTFNFRHSVFIIVYLLKIKKFHDIF